MRTNTVAAVIVTYNRLALLQECLLALQKQTRPVDGIIVINNSSTDGTREWLEEQPNIITVTQENRGGSFGFYTGIKTAYEKGYEWIWCMDDDGLPDLNALKELLNYESRKPCVMNGLVLDKENQQRIVFKTNGYLHRSQIKEPEVIEGAANPYNSTMFHAEVIKRAGLPRPELTIWGDETEFFNRIKYKQKLPVFTVIKSHHFHPAQFSQFYKKEWDMSFGWKVYFYVRNKRFVYSSQFASGFRAALEYGKFLTGFFGTILFYQRHNKIKKLRLMYSAAKDGLKKNTSKDMLTVRSLVQEL